MSIFFLKRSEALRIILEFSSPHRKITELIITFKNAKDEFLVGLTDDIHDKFWGFELFKNTAGLSKKEKDIFYHIAGISTKKLSSDSVIVSAPFDFLFLYKIFQFKPLIKIKNVESYFTFRKSEYHPTFFFIDNYQRISIKNLEKLYLLPTNYRYYVIDMVQKSIMPIKEILSHEVITEIFEDGSYYIDEEIKNCLILKRDEGCKSFEKYILLPEIIEVNDGKIYFDIRFYDKQFELFCFIKTGNLDIKINFDGLRQTLLFQENLLVELEGNRLAIIRNESHLYIKLKTINSVLQANFFKLLDEIKHDRIISSDTKTLFTNVAQSLSKFVSFQINGRPVAFYSIESKSLEVNIKETEKIDWFEVDFKIVVGGYEVKFEELNQIIENGYILKGDRVICLPAGEINKIKSVLSKVKILNRENTNYVRKEFLPLFLDILKDSKIKLPESVEEFRKKIYNIKKGNIPDSFLPQKMQFILRHYQKVGFYWLYTLYQYGLGGILADEMGLGKSIQVLSLLYKLKDKIGPSIIICPFALMNNWANEIEKFFDKEFNYIIVNGSREKREKIVSNANNYEILITSYNLFLQDEELYKNIKFEFCILDEAQHIKNKDAKRTKSVKKINARVKIALTGTPLENYPVELWSIFDFIMPDYLGTHRWFKKNIENPILKEEQDTRKEVVQIFQTLVSPYILRRTKDRVLKDLPDKIEQEIELELTEKQKILYLEILKSTKEKLFSIFEKKGLEKSYIDFLAALTRLRQICIHPGLVNRELFDEDEIAVKLQALMELIYEMTDSNHKVVIYSQFVEFLKFLRMRLYSENLAYLYLDGKTKDRPALIEYFNKSTDEKILLASIKAGGVGLNITGADSVIIVDPWWNPTVEAQAIDRLHRIGQKNIVFAYRLITKGTVEEKIRHLQFKKKKIASEIIDLPEELYKTLSISRIEELFRFE